MDQAAQPVPAQNACACHVGGRLRRPSGRASLQRPVRPVSVVVIGVPAQDQAQMPFAGYQHLFQAAGAPRSSCPASSNTPDPHDQYRRVRVTHPFHPLVGRDFEFIAYCQNWGEDRVHLHDENVQLFSLPGAWTDVVAADPFVVVAAGRCAFAADGLLAGAGLVVRSLLVGPPFMLLTSSLASCRETGNPAVRLNHVANFRA